MPGSTCCLMFSCLVMNLIRYFAVAGCGYLRYFGCLLGTSFADYFVWMSWTSMTILVFGVWQFVCWGFVL